MKVFRFDLKSFVALWTVIVLSGYLFGCSRPPTKTEVVGTYQRSYKGLSEKLVLGHGGNFYQDTNYSRSVTGVDEKITLKANGDFQQDIKYSDGNAWTTTGTWGLQYRAIVLKNVYQTLDFERNAVINPPRKAGSCIYVWNAGELTRDDEIGREWVKAKP